MGMNKKSNHQTENGNTFYLLQNLMKPSLSKFHQGKLTNLRTSWSLWNKETKEFFLQFAFKISQNEKRGGGPGGGFRPPGMPPTLNPGGVGIVPPPPPAFAPVPPPPPNM